jgi:hypothetical protein
MEYNLNCSNVLMDGGNGGSIMGGAVGIVEGAPRFINCKFEDNLAQGGNGQNGTAGCQQHPDGGDGGWPGRAYGGAVYAAFSSKPTFESCTFTGNQAFGGVGGNGGAGATIQGVWYHGGRGGGFLWPDSIEGDWRYWSWFDGWEDGDKYAFYGTYGTGYNKLGYNMFGRYDWETWAKWFGWTKWNSWQEFFASTEYQIADLTTPKVDGYDEYWKYSGYGGAVYVGYLSEASFINCVFEGNETRGSRSGVGAGYLPTPNRQLNLPNAGGAVYAAYDSSLVFENCRFADNLADTSTVDVPLTYEVSFGGAVAYEFDCDVTFINTDIQGNRSAVGGGIFGRDSTVQIADCNAFNNEAYLGAGLYIDHGSASITETLVQANKAKKPDVTVVPPDDEPGDDEPVVPVATIEGIGQGGGLYAASADLDVRHSVFVKNRADVSGGGLLLSGTVDTPSTLFNILFARNEAGRDGAGASANWESRATFGNCTFADNKDSGSQSFSLTGGGLYLAYNSIVDVVNSIFWGNSASSGSQITVGTGFAFDPRPSTLNISYTTVQNYGSAGAVFRGQGCTVNAGAGMLSSDPLFATLPDTPEEDVVPRYYLQIVSPSIDAGSTTSSALGLSEFTTSIFGGNDRGEVDLGYHYGIVRKSPCSITDFILSGRIDLADFARFALGWLEEPCGQYNNWCGGSDLNFDRVVDAGDLFNFTACWLATDDEPPFPSPSVWAIDPNAVPRTFDTVNMQIAETHDAWWPDAYLQYEFVCVNYPSFSSDWQSEPFYQRTGLNPELTYQFRTRARDGSGNVTEFSVADKYVKPGAGTTIPRAEFEIPPFVVTPTSISMTARAYATYPGAVSLPAGFWIQYQFEERGPATPPTEAFSALTRTWLHQGLTMGQTYTYRVRMVLMYQGADGPVVANDDLWSDPITITITPVDLDPPTPNPAAFIAETPFQFFRSADSTYYHICQAVEGADASGVVEYRFRCYTGATGGSAIIDSGWRTAASVVGQTYPNGQAQVPYIYWGNVGLSHPTYYWTVQYRDGSPAQNVGLESPRKQVQ